MIQDFKKIVDMGVNHKDTSFFGKCSKTMQDKYGVSEKTLYTRFKSVYGAAPREVIKSKLFPTGDQMDAYVLNATCSAEVRKQTGLSNRYFVGIYDKFYGVSTFQKARLVVLHKSKRLINPLREDNRALIYSQLLGDGSYDSKRHALRIIHGDKQAGYLKFKVDLLTSAYPQMNTKINWRQHKQGHKYVDYYTNLGNVDVVSEVEAVKLLTNLGWLLWYMDDGCYTQNVSICCARSKAVREAAIKELRTYGITARDDGQSVIMCGEENDLQFYMNFIEPYTSILPPCMAYKVEDIVERVCI